LIRKFPDAPHINFFYGTALYKNNELKEAVSRYQRVLELDPSYLEARLTLIEACLKLGKLEEAIAETGTLLKQNPDSIPGKFLQGIVQIRQAEQSNHDTALYQQALDQFNQLLEQAPEHLDAQSNRAYLLGRIQGISAMNEAFQEIAQEVPDTEKGILLFYWAKSLENLGYLEEASQKLSEARELSPDIDGKVHLISL
jgi:tetratricopeptide (TPR) repeat protein